MSGEAFGRKLVFIRYVDEYHEDSSSGGDDPYHGPATSWVDSCPDDVEPRSLDNPNTYSWDETWEDDWGDAPREQWYIVGAAGDWFWYGVDIDGDDEHERTVDFDKKDVRFPTRGALIALSKSGWPHCYTLHKDPPAVEPAEDGIDILSDVPSANFRGAVSPWHDDRREVLSDPVVKDKTRQLENALDDDKDTGFVTAEVDGESVELIEQKARTPDDVTVEIPDEMPEDVPKCIKRLAEVRMTNKRHEYGESPFEADTHLGQLLIANGYSVEEATAFLREHPPHKATGFDKQETEKQLSLLKSKHEAGDLHPPTKSLKIQWRDCDCAVHGEGPRGPTPGIIAPNTPISRADPTVDPLPDMNLGDVRGQTRNILSEDIELGVDTVIRIPPAGGKTYSAIKEIVDRDLPSVYSCGTHRNTNEACELMVEEDYHDFALPPSASRTGLDQDGNDLEHLNDTSCATFMGEHGEHEQERMQAKVEAADGSTRLVHKIAESDDSDIEMFPCQEGDGECNYVESWEKWDADATVQVCHYTHMNMDGLMTVGDNGPERVAFIDEFPAGAFETHWTGGNDDEYSISKLKDDVMAWLAQFQGRPSPSGETVWDALDNELTRDSTLDGLREAQTLEDLRGEHVPWDAVDTRDIEGALDNGWHPATSLVAYLYAKSTRLENGWRSAEAGKFRLTVEPNGDVHLLRPPELSNARQVIGLDATACEPMWRSVTGMDDLRAVDSMTTKQKKAYYKHALNIDVVQVSDWMKSMAGVGNSGNEAFRPDHAELVIDYLEHAADGEDTGLITSKQALGQMEKSGVGLDGVDMTGYYGNFKGENRFGDVNVGAVFGSNHPGDREIEKWAAYRGENAQREERPEGDQSDWELDYQNETANKVFSYYLEGAVMQAVVRFSRNEERGLVVVYTDRIPDEVPVHKAGLTKFAESRGDVLEAIEAGADSLEQAAARVNWSERTVRRAIDELEGAGAVELAASGELRAKGPVSRVGNIGGDGCPIITYRETVGDDSEELRSDPPERELLGVRALLMDVDEDDESAESTVQASISPSMGAD